MPDSRRRCSSLTLFLVIFSLPLLARAQSATSPGAKDTTPATAHAASEPALGALPTPTPSAAAASKPAGLDFDFFPPESGSAAGSKRAARDVRIDELARTRRHRLHVHQVLGMTTWALMGASCVIGQLNYNDLYGGGSGRGNYLMPHRLLVYSTSILFGVTAAYALLAPQPYKRPLRFDTGLIHRIAMIGATAGMLAQVVLGFITARTADAGNPTGLAEKAKIHAIVGWSTFGLMTVGGTVWVF